MTTAEALARVDAARIAFARVSTLPDLVRHAGVHGATCVQEGTEVHLPAHPAVIDGVRRGGGEVPALGAQDADLRAEFAPAMRRAPVPG
jgi:crotonobetainyl-CoA:carnitine CoA-transferase CaiB-like acyl-CoA transferase